MSLNKQSGPQQLVTGLTAAGTNQATALQLAGRNSLQEITTAAASTGVLLPALTELPAQVTVCNQGSNTLSIYPQLGATIDNGSANAAVTLGAGKAATYEASSLTNWYTVSTTGAGSGTVTSVIAGTGLAGGTITTTGTVSLATIGDASVLANTTGGTAAPAGVTLTALIDEAIGSTQGDVLYRGASTWSALAPGSSGKVLTSGGASANPSWQTSSSGITGLTGDVTTAVGSGVEAAFFSGQTTVITPASFSTEQDNYSPTGWLSTGVQAANCIRFTATAFVDVTGLAAPTSGNLEGVIVTLENAAGSSNYPVRLVTGSASSSAANRFSFPGNVFLAPGESITLKYDNTQASWREFGTHKPFNDTYWGTGQDGIVQITSNTTLTRDMYYQRLSFDGTHTLTTNGCRVYVSEYLDLSAAQAGAILCNGLAGNAGSGATGGGATAGVTAQTIGLGQRGVGGGTGTASGTSGSGTAGTAGNNGGTCFSGGAGGTSTATHGTGGGGGAVFPFVPYKATDALVYLASANPTNYGAIMGGASGGGGGAGAGDTTNAGGGGGGGSAGGGILAIFARYINRTNANAAILQAKSLTGGAGAAGVAGTAAGGGGGSAGGGGWVYICYSGLFGTQITNAIDVSGGAGGAGGAGASSGGGGTGGGSGNSGTVTLVNTTTGVSVQHASVSGGNGSGPSGSSGGPGASAVTAQWNL